MCRNIKVLRKFNQAVANVTAATERLFEALA